MREQHADIRPLKRRASAPAPQSSEYASRHRAGFHAGLHPEDRPGMSENLRHQIENRPTKERGMVRPPLPDDDRIYDTRLRTSTRRYAPLPKRATTVQQVHPLTLTFNRLLLLAGMVMGVAGLVGVILTSLVFPAISDEINTLTYGFPRTLQTTIVVGKQTYHLIAVNDNGTVELVDINENLMSPDPKLYIVTHLEGTDTDHIPITHLIYDSSKDELNVVVGQIDYVLYGDGKGDFSQTPTKKG